MAASLFGTGGVINANVRGSLVPQVFTATAGQTLFTLTAFTYSVGTGSLLVFINGSLQSLKDYAETSTGSFTLVEACLGGESILALGFPETTLDYNGVFATLASPAAGEGAGLVGFDWALIPAAINKADWGIHTARSGKPNILRLISPAEWAAILAGTSTYDCTTELETAITSWSGFYAPAGLYRFSRPLAWYGVEDGNAITIEGDGSSLTILQKTTTTAGSGSNVQRGSTVTDSYAVDAGIILKANDNYFNCHTTLRGFRLKTSASGVYGIYAPRTSRLTLQDVNIYGFTVGFYTFDSWFTEFSKVEINCLNRASSYGIRWANDGSGSATGTTVNLHRVYVRQAVYGYHLYGIDYASLSNCACDTGYTGGGGSLPYYFESCNIEMTGSGAENHTLRSNGAIVRVSGGHLTLLNFRGYLITGAANAGSIYASDNARVTIGGVRIDDYAAVNGAYNYRCEVGAAIFRAGANSLPTNGSATVTYSSGAYELQISQTTPQYKNAAGTYNVDLSLRASGSYDPAALGAGAFRSTLTLTVTGAAVGDYCTVSFSNPVTGYNWSGFVTATDTVTITEHNTTAGSLDPGSGTVRVRVTKQ